MENEEALTFWNAVHRGQVRECIGGTDYDSHRDAFNRVGPFAHDFERARTYLDIGPGFGVMLSKSGAFKRAAMDISEVGLANIKFKYPDIDLWTPHDMPPDRSYDLITCASCIQHQDRRAADRTLQWAHTALSDQGKVYLQGITSESVLNNEFNDMRLKQGKYYWTVEQILSMWPGKCAKYDIWDTPELQSVGIKEWLMLLVK